MVVPDWPLPTHMSRSCISRRGEAVKSNMVATWVANLHPAWLHEQAQKMLATHPLGGLFLACEDFLDTFFFRVITKQEEETNNG